jgi:hypothetical protein
MHILRWFGERLSERSTWVGLTALATVLGINVSPENMHAIITVGGLVGGAINTITRDK